MVAMVKSRIGDRRLDAGRQVHRRNVEAVADLGLG